MSLLVPPAPLDCPEDTPQVRMPLGQVGDLRRHIGDGAFQIRRLELGQATRNISARSRFSLQHSGIVNHVAEVLALVIPG